jgi:transposase
MHAKKVSYEVVYNYHKRIDRTGKASVHIKAYQNGKRQYRDTGIRLAPDDWDEQKNEVKKRPDLNRFIRDIVSDTERIVR